MITLWPVVAPLAAFALARALMGRRQRDFDRHVDQALAVVREPRHLLTARGWVALLLTIVTGILLAPSIPAGWWR